MLNRCAGLSNLAKEKPIDVRPAIHPSPSPCQVHATMPASRLLRALGPLPLDDAQKLSQLLRTKQHYCGVLTEQGGQG